MEKIIMFVVESTAISALLYLLYCVLFKGKASYFAQRVLLLSIPIVATLSAFASFEFIELRGWGGEVLEELIIDDEAVVETQQLTKEEISTEGFKIIRSDGYHFGIEDFTLFAWAIISLMLLSLFVWQLTKIVSLRKVAAKEIHSDYSIYRLWSGDLIFSFWRGIYIGADLEGERLDFVLRHELEHIRRCHYVDKLLAEIYSIFIWFNPIVRVIQRELSLIHEYEADHAVMKSGCDVKAYKMFIFEAIAAPVPTFANGINSSQIKKRFIAMKKSNQVSHRVLRTVVTIITFTAIAATSVVYVEAKETTRNALNDIPKDEIQFIDINDGQITITKKDGTVVSYDSDEPLKVNINPSKPKGMQFENARRDQLYVTRSSNYNRPIYIVRCEDHTKVYVGATVMWDKHWFVLSEETCLIDPNSGDKYMLHSSGTDLPIESVFWIRNLKGKYIYFELIFPPLDKDVKRVDFKEWAKAATTEGYNNRSHTEDHIGWFYPNVEVDNELPYFVSSEYQTKQDKESRVIKLDDNFEPK